MLEEGWLCKKMCVLSMEGGQQGGQEALAASEVYELPSHCCFAWMENFWHQVFTSAHIVVLCAHCLSSSDNI